MPVLPRIMGKTQITCPDPTFATFNGAHSGVDLRWSRFDSLPPRHMPRKHVREIMVKPGHFLITQQNMALVFQVLFCECPGLLDAGGT
jgi:hypothetical protein